MFSKKYSYYKYAETLDSYGQPRKNTLKAGEVNIAIFLNTENLSENPLYSDCEYIGKTFSNCLSPDCFISFENKELKVKYVNKVRNYFLVYLQKVG